MLECFIMGDSIAYGIATYQKQCYSAAQVGITSDKWFKVYNIHPVYKDNTYKIAVISLGTNDFKNVTADALYNIRSGLKAEKVIWILPSLTLKPIQRTIIREIASEFKDGVMDITSYLSRDGIHPTGKGYITIGNSMFK